MNTLFVLVLAIVAMSCTHHVVLKEYGKNQIPFGSLRGKKVAVVFAQGAVPSDFVKTKSDVHTFVFQDLSEGLKVAFENRLSSSVESLTFVKFADVPPGYDIYLYPSLKIRSVNDFWTLGCLVNYGLEVKDKDWKTLAKASKEGKRNFAFTSQAENKCREAMAQVFEEVTSTALESVN